MKYWKAVLVGVVQGVTEFLPVSSSGHLALLARFSLAPSSVFYSLSLHLATLFAVLIVMRREVWAAARHPLKGDGKYILLASLPTLIIALLFTAFLPNLLEGALLGFGFLLTSVILFSAELFGKKKDKCDLTVGNVLFTGVMQGIAVLPGVSRSGSTISSLRLAGVSEERAASFSFLLSLPIIVGGFLLEGVKSGFSAEGADAVEILIAALSAFVSGALSVRLMLRQVKKGFKPFIPYTFLLGVLCYFLP